MDNLMDNLSDSYDILEKSKNMGSFISSEQLDWLDQSFPVVKHSETIPYDEIPLPVKSNSFQKIECNIDSKNTTRVKNGFSMTVKKPKTHIFVLKRDNEVVCFSQTKKEILNAMERQRKKIMSSYLLDSSSDSRLYFKYSDDNEVVDIYCRNYNMLLSYDRLVCKLNISKVPHFLFEASKTH